MAFSLKSPEGLTKTTAYVDVHAELDDPNLERQLAKHVYQSSEENRPAQQITVQAPLNREEILQASFDNIRRFTQTMGDQGNVQLKNMQKTLTQLQRQLSEIVIEKSASENSKSQQYWTDQRGFSTDSDLDQTRERQEQEKVQVEALRHAQRMTKNKKAQEKNVLTMTTKDRSEVKAKKQKKKQLETTSMSEAESTESSTESTTQDDTTLSSDSSETDEDYTAKGARPKRQSRQKKKQQHKRTTPKRRSRSEDSLRRLVKTKENMFNYKLFKQFDNRKVPNIAKFDEESGQELSEYLNKFEVYCKNNFKTDEDFWIDELESLLTGHTLKAFKSMKDVNETYRHIKKKLLKWYGNNKQQRKKDKIKKFERAKYIKGEGYTIYATRLEKLYKLAHPQHHVKTSKRLIEKYVKSVPKNFRSSLKVMITSKKADSQAITWPMIQKIARIHDADRVTTTSETNTDSETSGEEAININVAQNTNMQQEQNTVQHNRGATQLQSVVQHKERPQVAQTHNTINNQNTKQQCTFCNKIGHNENQCYHKYNQSPFKPNYRSTNNTYSSTQQNNTQNTYNRAQRQNANSPNTVPQCTYCGKRGHVLSNCFQRQYNDREFRNTTSNNNTNNSSENKQQCSYCNRPNHTEQNCRKKLKLCFLCGARDHFFKECPKSRNSPQRLRRTNSMQNIRQANQNSNNRQYRSNDNIYQSASNS